jgi:calcineurin-like phosphoesterase family protein
MIYFTSDTHFGHANIIKYSGRPYKDVPHMNEMLIQNWNEVVQSTDTIIHLGDFAMGPKTEHAGFLKRLAGYKILIRGNHDQSEEKMKAQGWNEVYINRLLEIDGKKVYLSHVPPRSEDPYGDRFYHTEFTPEPPEHDIWFCGHVHEKFLRRGNIINVGVDVWNFRPQTFQTLLTAEHTPDIGVRHGRHTLEGPIP